MASTVSNPAVLLKRILSLREPSPLLLCVDTAFQSSESLIKQFTNQPEITVTYVSFETLNRPEYATEFIDANGLSVDKLISTIQAHPAKLVIIDSINYISADEVTRLITMVSSPESTLLTTYHSDIPEPVAKYDNYPGSLQLLSYIATTIFEIHSPSEEHLGHVSKNCNSKRFSMTVTNRRKSGRSLSYKFNVDDQDISVIVETKKEEELDQMEGLTTFNLGMSQSSKMAKEQVELPFMEAQKFNTGGAIVYEFEKDDDYDEEDPYEDPF